jgi:hypothetical protein
MKLWIWFSTWKGGGEGGLERGDHPRHHSAMSADVFHYPNQALCECHLIQPPRAAHFADERSELKGGRGQVVHLPLFSRKAMGVGLQPRPVGSESL